MCALDTPEDIDKFLRRCRFDDQLNPNAAPVAAVRTPSTNNKFHARQGARAVRLIEAQTGSGNHLTPHSATAFRALAARANYLAHDRPDLAYAAKELCRQLAVPTTDSLDQLKRLIRYIVRCPRLVFHVRWQERSPSLNVHVDTDFAGCRITRRSTSGGVTFRGDTVCVTGVRRKSLLS